MSATDAERAYADLLDATHEALAVLVAEAERFARWVAAGGIDVARLDEAIARAKALL